MRLRFHKKRERERERVFKLESERCVQASDQFESSPKGEEERERWIGKFPLFLPFAR